MSRRRRRRDRVSDHATERHRLIDDVIERSKYARLKPTRVDEPREAHRVFERVKKLVRQVDRKVPHVRPRSLRPFTISENFARTKHGNVRDTRVCVGEKLSGFSQRSGSGSSKKKSRSKSRRELFQAARKSC